MTLVVAALLGLGAGGARRQPAAGPSHRGCARARAAESRARGAGPDRRRRGRRACAGRRGATVPAPPLPSAGAAVFGPSAPWLRTPAVPPRERLRPRRRAITAASRSRRPRRPRRPAAPGVLRADGARNGRFFRHLGRAVDRQRAPPERTSLSTSHRRRRGQWLAVERDGRPQLSAHRTRREAGRVRARLRVPGQPGVQRPCRPPSDRRGRAEGTAVALR